MASDGSPNASRHPDAERGRGAPNNDASGRFDALHYELDGDWRDQRVTEDGVPPPIRTEVTIERPKSILSRNNSPDIPFEQSINPYRGCEHGCIYCYARPTHAFHGLSPGLDFETRLFAKPNAAELLRTTMMRPAYKPRVIAMGTNTDPYQPIEGRFEITRSILELCLEARNPVSITTKSDRLLRDVRVLADLARHDLVAIAISVTTLDVALARRLEPRATTPPKRIAAIRKLAEAGIPMHISISPIIPAITDGEIEALVEAGASAGALSASFIPIRLPHEVAPLFRAWLDHHYPDRAAKVMHIIQSMRGGSDNDSRYGQRMRGTGPWAELVRTRFNIAVRRHGLNRHKWTLREDLFVRPCDERQLTLF
ncbi:MAG: PA0069 family radical SAM protein [Blastomonas sp.]